MIADRNPHVRQFLKREMQAEGYRVQLARNGRQVLECAFRHEPLDLIILDLDLPDAEEFPILEKLQNRIPTLPVVVHTFLSDCTAQSVVLSTGAFVEKDGTNIDRLKKVISEVLRKAYPRRFDAQHPDQGAGVWFGKYPQPKK